jgi:hypothetical protein
VEPALQVILSSAAKADRECEFCGATPAADFDVLLRATMNGFRNEFSRIDEENVSYDSREGGYQIGSTFVNWDLIYGDEFESLFGDPVAERVLAKFHDHLWVHRDPFARDRRVVLTEAWTEFSAKVTYEEREDYWRTNLDEPFEGVGELTPNALLRSIDETLGELDLVESQSLVDIWRCRPIEAGWPAWRSRDMGTPPSSVARANRMSPAGVGLFYGSESKTNAMQELRNYAGGVDLACAPFSTSSGLRVLNLTKLPPVPSPFDPRYGKWRREILCLRHFSKEVSKRLASSGAGYAPTQVVANFFFNGPSRWGIEAISFASSLDPNEAVWAANIPNARCIDHGESAVSGGPNLVMTADPVLDAA